MVGSRLCSTMRRRSSWSVGSAASGASGGVRRASCEAAMEERHQTSVKRLRSAGESSFLPKSPAGFIVAHTRNPLGAWITYVPLRAACSGRAGDAHCGDADVVVEEVVTGAGARRPELCELLLGCSLSTKQRSRGSSSHAQTEAAMQAIKITIKVSLMDSEREISYARCSTRKVSNTDQGLSISSSTLHN